MNNKEIRIEGDTLFYKDHGNIENANLNALKYAYVQILGEVPFLFVFADHQHYISVEELRRVAHNLMPDLLVKYGLEVAIQEFASRISNSALDIHTEFINYRNSLSEEKQLIIYRIIQELVNNAIKHADASEIIIQISQEESVLNLTVEDNGKGFDQKVLNVKKTAGFHNIESRVQFLKGTMSIISELNIGTSIELQIPIH